MPTDPKPLPEPPTLADAEPSSQETAQRDQARRLADELAAELAPECPTAEPLPAPRSTESQPSPGADIADSYSHHDLWQMFTSTYDTALTQATEIERLTAEIDRLKRFNTARDAAAQLAVNNNCNEYNRLLKVQEEQYQNQLASQAKQLQSRFADRDEKRETKHKQELATVNANAKQRITDAENQANQRITAADNRASKIQHQFKMFVGLILGTPTVLALIIYWKFF